MSLIPIYAAAAVASSTSGGAIPEAVKEYLKNLILSHFPGYNTIQVIGECTCWICNQTRANGGDLMEHLWKSHRQEVKS